MSKIKVGIVGCGTIGSLLAKALCQKFKNEIQIVALCDHHLERAKILRQTYAKQAVVTTLDQVIAVSDLIVEAAATEVAAEVAKKALQLDKKVLIMSVGGLLKISNLAAVIKKSSGVLKVPSGALAGIDAVLGASESKIKSAKLITRKPPAGLKGAPYFQKKAFPRLTGKNEVCVFRGTALEAVSAFPQNINVAAVLSLAGIGAKKTQVEIWTSKKYKFNQHEIQVESTSGKIIARTENKPSPLNPKTSYLAVLSAVATIRRMISSFQIGT